MNLKDMKRSGKEAARYTLTLADDQGAKDYELTITGTRALVEKVFAKSDFEIIISPNTNEQEAERRGNALWKKHSATVKDVAPAEDTYSLRKSAPKNASGKNAIVISLRRTRGEGTFLSLWFPALFIPRGVSLFFAAPPAVHLCQGSVFPLPLVGGDPDLFLTLNGFSPPVVSSSTRGGPAIDTVSFIVPIAFIVPTIPPIIIRSPPVMPCYRVLGFSTSLTGFFCWSV